MLESIHRAKTGALLRASVRMGGICAGADQAQLEALSKYGEHVGLAFQIVDDILDALEAAAHDNSDTRIFNIGSGCGRTVREVISATEVLLSKKIDIAWQAGRPSDVPISVVSIERANRVFDWSPKTSFENGLELTISWWRDYLS